MRKPPPLRPKDQKIQDITDSELLQLLDELHEVSGVELEPFQSQPIQAYLQQAIYPDGNLLSPQKITRDALDGTDFLDEFILRKRVGLLKDATYDLIRDLAITRKLSIEKLSSCSVYTTLSKLLKIPKETVRKKKSR